MCVISILKTVPSQSDLDDMILQNPHGNGFSIRTKENKIEFFKGFNLTSVDILDIIKTYGFNQGDEIEFVFHARITSVGKTCDSLKCDYQNPSKEHNCLCHGFVKSKDNYNPQRATLDDESEFCLYHNGTMSISKLKFWCNVIKKEKNLDVSIDDLDSDTQCLNFLVSHLGLKFLEEFAKTETTSKFCVHSVKHGIMYYNGFEKQDKNILCSNLYHTFYKPRKFNTNTNVIYDSSYDYNYCPFDNPECVNHDWVYEDCQTSRDVAKEKKLLSEWNKEQKEKRTLKKKKQEKKNNEIRKRFTGFRRGQRYGF